MSTQPEKRPADRTGNRNRSGDLPRSTATERAEAPEPPETVPIARRRPAPTEGIVWEPSERWVRGVKRGVTVVDSRRAVLVWEPGTPVPHYAFPEPDVRTDLLRRAAEPRTARHGQCAVYFDLEVEGEVAENAAWAYPGGELAGHIAFEWFGRQVLDHWYEEETEIFVHPRDPYKRVDALPSSRHVQVEINGTVVADTRRPVLLFETRLPVRYYIPREDIRFHLLTPDSLQTQCPYKGVAAEYWSWTGTGDVPRNVAWSYPDPLPAVAAIKGLVAFYNEAVDIILDGERLERPDTYFSKRLGR